MGAATSIIMPAYNAAPYIGDAVESVRAQTRDDWELIIVDDGSVDGTGDIVRSFSADPRIRLIRQENQGAPAARNAAAAEASTPFLSMLDADDAWAPDYLERVIGALEADEQLAFCCCDAFIFETDRVPGNRCSKNVLMVPPVTLERVAARDFQVYTSVSLRRSWFDRVGGFDAALHNAQDFDLWLRILADGGRARFLDAPLAWYRRTPGSLSSNEIRLHQYTLKVYEKLAAARPELVSLCARMTEKLRYEVALGKAKNALSDGAFDAFHAHARDALALRRNPKLAAAAAVARLSPGLARRVFAMLN